MNQTAVDPPRQDGPARRHATAGAFCLSLILIALLGLGVRLYFINTTMGPSLIAMANQQHIGATVIPSRRGRILDRRGRVVATTRSMADVFIDGARVDDLDAVAGPLGARLNQEPAAIVERVRRRPQSRYIVLARRVDRVTADAVKALKHPGIGVTQQPVRVYPLGSSMAHVVGFVGRDHHGLEGMELQFDKHLSGEDGRIGTLHDARRRALWRRNEDYKPPTDGGDVYLTIDAEVQRFTEEALRDSVAEFEAESGVVVVMIPHTGEVLAMASYPTFDPNAVSDSQLDHRRNRVLTDSAEPGSTFKPFIACGALHHGVITTSEKFNCHNGRYYIGGRVVQDTRPSGYLDLTGIITRSSNIGMAQIGKRMGDALLHDTMLRFGFGARTGIECPGESSGLVYALARWSSMSGTSVSFGYEVNVTPLQLITAFSAILNDGVLLRPHILRRLTAPDGSTLAVTTTPDPVGQVIAPEVARFMRDEALVSVVENGSCRTVLSGDYSFLGKTGTAKLLYADRPHYEPGAYASTFIGAAPASNPQVAAVMIVRRPNPRIGYYGSKVCAPAVGEIITSTLRYLGVPPDRHLASGS